MLSARLYLCFVALMAVLSAGNLAAQTAEQTALELDGVSVTEKIGEKLPLDFVFVDDNNKTVRLAQYFTSGRPVIITFNYSDCVRFCDLQLNDMANAFKAMKLDPGTDFTVLTISVDPNETFKKAKSSKLGKLGLIGDKRYDKNWHFLTTTEEADIITVASALGYKYKYDAKRNVYKHKAAMMIVNGGGVISHYVRGIGYRAEELELVLKKSAAGEMGEPSEDGSGFGLNCFIIEYTDAVARGMTVMRIGGGLVLSFMILFLGYFWVKEFKKGPKLEEATQ